MFNPIFSKIIGDDIDSCYFYIKDVLQAVEEIGQI